MHLCRKGDINSSVWGGRRMREAAAAEFLGCGEAVGCYGGSDLIVLCQFSKRPASF